jgi:hypothetical protein
MSVLTSWSEWSPPPSDEGNSRVLLHFDPPSCPLLSTIPTFENGLPTPPVVWNEAGSILPLDLSEPLCSVRDPGDASSLLGSDLVGGRPFELGSTNDLVLSEAGESLLTGCSEMLDSDVIGGHPLDFGPTEDIPLPEGGEGLLLGLSDFSESTPLEDPSSILVHRCFPSQPRGSLSNERSALSTLPRRYPCTIEGCPKTFSRKSNAKAHLRTHDKNRNYRVKCGICGRLFTRRADLVRHHKDVHLQERRHCCHHCLRSFSRRDSLERLVLFYIIVLFI